ncbi:hypothetical protein NKI38_08960 [Mesorhizobium sp. M0621]|uniref:hypothetical protein n=1 Tax=Mesorhizobium sp. M0621 TaxID=2956974 RepID=UPI00333949FB
MERFEILEEPTGTFSIFDTFTELPVTVESRWFLAAAVIVDAERLAADEDDRPLSDDLLA